MQLKKAINSYLRHMSVYASKGYYIFNQQQATAILRYFDEYTELENMTFKDVYKFIEDSKAEGLKNNTVNKRIAFLRRLARFNDINNDLTNLKELRVQFVTYGRVNNEEIEIVNNAIKKFKIVDRVIYGLLRDTGARVNELLHIKAFNINMRENSITLDVTKTGKQRQVFFTEETKKLIKRYIKEKEINTNDKTLYLLKDFNIDREKINLLFKRIRNATGVNKISPHRLRHTLASELYNNGCDILYISRFLGHCNLETTRNYILVNGAQAQAIYNKYIGV